MTVFDDIQAEAEAYRSGPLGHGAEGSDPSRLGFTIEEWDARAAFAGEAPPQRWLVSGVIPRGVAGLIPPAGDLGKSFTGLE